MTVAGGRRRPDNRRRPRRHVGRRIPTGTAEDRGRDRLASPVADDGARSDARARRARGPAHVGGTVGRPAGAGDRGRAGPRVAGHRGPRRPCGRRGGSWSPPSGPRWRPSSSSCPGPSPSSPAPTAGRPSPVWPRPPSQPRAGGRSCALARTHRELPALVGLPGLGRSPSGHRVALATGLGRPGLGAGHRGLGPGLGRRSRLAGAGDPVGPGPAGPGGRGRGPGRRAGGGGLRVRSPRLPVRLAPGGHRHRRRGRRHRRHARSGRPVPTDGGTSR